MQSRSPPEKARALLGPLVGIYELRHADAHLAGSDIDEAFALARVDRAQPFLFQGYDLLYSCVSSLHAILEVLKELPDRIRETDEEANSGAIEESPNTWDD